MMGALFGEESDSMPQRKPRQLPTVGSVFEKTFRGEVYRLTVVKTGEGVRFKIGGKTFRTPSGAAKSITGSEVNGWSFWGIDERS
jgi:hypothetical protein